MFIYIYMCYGIVIDTTPLYAVPQERKGNCFQEQRYKVTNVTVSRVRWKKGEKGFNKVLNFSLDTYGWPLTYKTEP